MQNKFKVPRDVPSGESINVIENEINLLWEALEAIKQKPKLEKVVTNYHCACDVAYTGTHRWPCKARRP